MVSLDSSGEPVSVLTASDLDNLEDLEVRDLKSLTVSQLKKICASKGKPISGVAIYIVVFMSSIFDFMPSQEIKSNYWLGSTMLTLMQAPRRFGK